MNQNSGTGTSVAFRNIVVLVKEEHKKTFKFSREIVYFTCFCYVIRLRWAHEFVQKENVFEV